MLDDSVSKPASKNIGIYRGAEFHRKSKLNVKNGSRDSGERVESHVARGYRAQGNCSLGKRPRRQHPAAIEFSRKSHSGELVVLPVA